MTCNVRETDRTIHNLKKVHITPTIVHRIVIFVKQEKGADLARCVCLQGLLNCNEVFQTLAHLSKEGGLN